MLPDAPAERYRVVAHQFSVLVDAVPDWDAPSPVDGWIARDVVWHLVDWFPALMNGSSAIKLPTRDGGADPSTAWRMLDAAVQAMLDDPATADAPFAHQFVGEMSVVTATEMLYTPDVFMHSWDLARAAGLPLELDADYAATLLAGMEAMEDVIRSSGHYGTRTPVPTDATVQDELIAFIGRDPAWTPADTLSREGR